MAACQEGCGLTVPWIRTSTLARPPPLSGKKGPFMRAFSDTEDRDIFGHSRVRRRSVHPTFEPIDDRISYAQPEVEPGSTLATMAALSPSSARTCADAVIHEIERCAGSRCADREPEALNLMLEEIHTLKNSLAFTGSRELLRACERLRLDACDGHVPSTLHRRYKAVANAGAKLVKKFKDSLPTPITDF